MMKTQKKSVLINITLYCALFSTISFGATLTQDNAAPVGDDKNAQTAGQNGPILLQDGQLMEKIQHFDRERTPERIVHARGTGAYGEFVSNGNAADITKATVFAAPGKVTPVFVRFSIVVNAVGSPETLRDLRGFATKFYSDQGNWNLLGNDAPVLFIRDPMKFPDMVHAFKPSPVTNVQDANRIFDFLSHQPESTFAVSMLFSDIGIPASYRMMDGHSVNAYKFINAKGEVRYVKFHWKSLQGIKSLTNEEAEKIQGKDFNHLTNDLYGALARKEFPKWDLYVQVLEAKDFNKFKFDPLDDTKIWPGIPERKLGTLTLNKIPDNFFEATDQAAFPISEMIPGVEPSEDRIVQARFFAEKDAAIHRLGVNFAQLPVNRPRVPVMNYNQDGSGNQMPRKGDITYSPSVYAQVTTNPHDKASETPLSGTTQQTPYPKADNFEQAGDFYRSLDKGAQDRLIATLGGALAEVKDPQIRQTMLSYFYKADATYGTNLTKAAGGDLADVKARASQLSDA